RQRLCTAAECAAGSSHSPRGDTPAPPGGGSDPRMLVRREGLASPQRETRIPRKRLADPGRLVRRQGLLLVLGQLPVLCALRADGRRRVVDRLGAVSGRCRALPDRSLCPLRVYVHVDWDATVAHLAQVTTRAAISG